MINENRYRSGKRGRRFGMFTRSNCSRSKINKGGIISIQAKPTRCEQTSSGEAHTVHDVLIALSFRRRSNRCRSQKTAISPR